MPDLRAMSQQPQIDPDVSATLTDFLAYTEHLPSAVIRSMTLIGEQDKIAADLQQRIHELLTTYSALGSQKDTKDGPNAATLRRDISHAYDRLEKARRMAAAESVRVAEMVNRDQIRLDVITRKLKTMPMPPSRDPTPEPVSSPQMKKSQPIAEKRAAHRVGSAPRVRGRKIMVPGEVLPPPNPDSPPPSEASDVESTPPSPPAERKRQKSTARARTPKPPKEKKEKDKDRTPKPPRVRTPGQPGTNVHSTVAGISTSNALLALVPPPPDAVPGSKWLPWKRITEYELAKLRKRMKKNAIWLPSPAMRNRELKHLGRGQQNMELARQQAEETGQPFIDESGPSWTDPTRVTTDEDKGTLDEILAPELDGGDEDELMNRGMRLNEAKKRKREKMLEEQAIQAQLTSEQSVLEANTMAIEPVNGGAITEETKSSLKPPSTSKKRKRDTTPAQPIKPATTASPETSHQPKKIKLSIPAQPMSGPSSGGPRSPRPIKESRPPRPQSRHASQAPDATTATVTTSIPTTTDIKRPSTKITLKRSKAASAEPPNRRHTLRRGSNVSLPGAGRAGSVDSRPSRDEAAVAKQEGRGGRRKRPAPGFITADEDGRAKGAVGKRKAAPRKRGRKSDGTKVEEGGREVKEEDVEGLEEAEVDPNEPRYCLCGDVSWGTMVACENMVSLLHSFLQFPSRKCEVEGFGTKMTDLGQNCPIEWFHLECVDLSEMPPRLAKWYCPECRKGDPEKGSETNGIVKRGK